MVRKLLALILSLCAFAALTQGQSGSVQAIGDVSFAVPDGWAYTNGADFGAMIIKEGARFWMVSVYTPMPSSGNPDADFKAAWRRAVLSAPGFQRVPNYNPYDISPTLGYPGKYYDDSNTNGTAYVRLYALETGKSCVPVAFFSRDRNMLDGMDHMAMAIAGSVRVSPAKASPIRTTISVADLAGQWTTGLVTSIDFYNSSGQYQSNQLTAVRANYNIAAGGRYTYSFGGMINNRSTQDADAGVVALGGGFIVLKGQKRETRYRFVYLEQALDGSTVLALFPPVDLSQINSTRDITFWTRPLKR